jgi:hypothetical protein
VVEERRSDDDAGGRHQTFTRLHPRRCV